MTPATRQPPRLRRTLQTLTCLLTASGILWLLAHHALPLPEDAARHPLEAWSLRIHGGVAMAALFALGAATWSHVPAAWRLRRNMTSGLLLTVLWLALGLTGYGLYYLTDDTWRTGFSLAHWLAGLAVPVALALHLLRPGCDGRS